LLLLLLGAVVVRDLDGFHPNNEGQRDIAQLLLRVIVPKLGVRQASLGSGQWHICTGRWCLEILAV